MVWRALGLLVLLVASPVLPVSVAGAARSTLFQERSSAVSDGEASDSPGRSRMWRCTGAACGPRTSTSPSAGTSPPFDDACRRVPDFGVEVIKALSFKVRWVTMIVANVTTKDTRSRLCQLLLAFGSLFGAEDDDDILLLRKFSLGDVGMMIGCSRQWTTSTMGELRDLGAVPVVEGGYLRIHPARLREATGVVSDDA